MAKESRKEMVGFLKEQGLYEKVISNIEKRIAARKAKTKTLKRVSTTKRTTFLNPSEPMQID